MRLLIAALLLVHGAAMGQTFACQYTAAAGLDWVNGQWSARQFKPFPPFFLRLKDGAIDPESLAEIIGNPSECISTRLSSGGNVRDSDWFCFNKVTSRTLVFSGDTASGGTSRLFGSLMKSSGAYKDSIGVEPFICQRK